MYGKSLWWFLRHRWISPVIWVLCLAGTIGLFMLVPKAFLPPGDSSVIFGAFIAREGSSPAQMQSYQDRVDEVSAKRSECHHRIHVDWGNRISGVESGHNIYLHQATRGKKADRRGHGGDDGQTQHDSRSYDLSTTLSRLEISTGVTSQNQGQYAFTVSGANPIRFTMSDKN